MGRTRIVDVPPTRRSDSRDAQQPSWQQSVPDAMAP
jgi:hypothetical protein